MKKKLKSLIVFFLVFNVALFSGSDTYKNKSFTDYDFSDRNLSFEDFSSSDVSGASFKGTNLAYTSFFIASCIKATFDEATFKYGSLANAWCHEAKFKNSSFKRTCMVEATFNDADFSKATLFKCNLRSAYFFRTKFINSDISGSFFDGSVMFDCIIGITDKEKTLVQNTSFKDVIGLTNEQKEYLRKNGALNVPEDCDVEKERALYDKEMERRSKFFYQLREVLKDSVEAFTLPFILPAKWCIVKPVVWIGKSVGNLGYKSALELKKLFDKFEPIFTECSEGLEDFFEDNGMEVKGKK